MAFQTLAVFEHLSQGKFLRYGCERRGACCCCSDCRACCGCGTGGGGNPRWPRWGRLSTKSVVKLFALKALSSSSGVRQVCAFSTQASFLSQRRPHRGAVPRRRELGQLLRRAKKRFVRSFLNRQALLETFGGVIPSTAGTASAARSLYSQRISILSRTFKPCRRSRACQTTWRGMRRDRSVCEDPLWRWTDLQHSFSSLISLFNMGPLVRQRGLGCQPDLVCCRLKFPSFILMRHVRESSFAFLHGKCFFLLEWAVVSLSNRGMQPYPQRNPDNGI